MSGFSPYSVYYFTLMIEDEEIIDKFLFFLAALPEYVYKNLNYYSFDEICYFALICTVNSCHL